MEALICGNGIPVNELCRSLENGLVLRRGIVSATGGGWKARKSKKLVSQQCRTISTISDRDSSSVLSGFKWRLDDELDKLTDLELKLRFCGSLREKCGVLDRNPRVRKLFGKENSKPWIRSLGEYDLYLIKCIVAVGQEHLLGGLASSENNNNLHVNAGVNGRAKGGLEIVANGSSPQKSSSVLKEAFQLMSQVIESLDDPRSSEVFQWPSFLRKDNGAGVLREKKRGFDELHEGETLQSLKSFLRVLDSLEKFYDCIGGIIGYQLAGLQLIRNSEVGEPRIQQKQEIFYHVPEGKDLSEDVEFATQAAGWGVSRLGEMAEIYPLGGAGDRLGLVDEITGESLPVAMLPYCGRTLLEGLIRDLQAREFLHYKIYGTRVITPVAIMTSAAKLNNKRVLQLLETHGWFGRGKENFRLFEQPLVPTIASENARWVASGALDLVLKPGGHGVIWKLAKDSDLFNWFREKSRKAAVIRQISNPLAATDVTLLALSGVGLQHRKKFGFASCDRRVGAAEGVNVLMESKAADGRWRYGITCVEYTDFRRLGIADVPVSTGSLQAKFPANANVLFVDLDAVEDVVSGNGTACLPGMIMNLKKPVTYTDNFGQGHSISAGRIECTMQNIADSLQNQFQHRQASIDHENLDTYILYNQRRKVTSSAKRRRKLGEESLHQTPDGSFLDVTRNAAELLTSCGVHMPKMEANYCYVETGPPFIFLLHPAVGPLWDIIRQKIQGGSISQGSEVQLEVAELVWRNVHINGSFLVEAENIMGYVNSENVLQYGERSSRCRLENVQIINSGVDWKSASNVYWQCKVRRHEALKVILKGRSEFHAINVTIQGSHTFEVPDGYKMTLEQADSGFACKLEPLISSSWDWSYSMQNDGRISLELLENKAEHQCS